MSRYTTQQPSKEQLQSIMPIYGRLGKTAVKYNLQFSRNSILPLRVQAGEISLMVILVLVFLEVDLHWVLQVVLRQFLILLV